MAEMVKCKTCGKELPQTEVLKHYKLEHPRGKESLGQTPKKETETPPSPTKPPEPQAPASPPVPETKPAPEPTPPEAKPAAPPEAKVEPPKVEKEKKEEEITEPTVSPDGIFAYTIHLPADAFTLFGLAKFSGLEKDSDKPFDEWLWDCVMKRFETDYKRQLVLAPIKEEVKDGQRV